LLLLYSSKKKDDARPVHKDLVHYFSTLVVDYLAVVLPILLVFTVSATSRYLDLLR
jgi:glucosaminylphosphatidylinositol acyltransferase